MIPVIKKINNLRQVLKEEQLYASLSLKLLNKFSTIEDWENVLIVNHQRSNKEKNMVKQARKLSVYGREDWPSLINQLIIQDLKAKVRNQIQTNNYAIHQSIDIINDNNDSFTITNLWQKSVTINGLKARFNLSINFPNSVQSQANTRQVYKDRLIGISLPICWNKDFYQLTNYHSSVTAKLTAIYDPKVSYVFYGGQLANAKQLYARLSAKQNSVPWYQKLFQKKIQDYDEWVKGLVKGNEFINDSAIYDDFQSQKDMQLAALRELQPAITDVQDEFNYVWHDILKYPKLIFGKSHLTF